MSDTNPGKTRVLIIGFGPSGIVATHYFSAAGERFEITTVEAGAELGGVWNPSSHYPGFRANNSRNTFELPDLRHKPGQYDDFPTQAQVNAYLGDYVAEFDLAKYVHFGVRVERLVRRRDADAQTFEVEFSAPVDGSTTGSYDFVVVATGFTHTPWVPDDLADTSKLERAMLHSSTINAALAEDPELCAGKRVAVIGGSKSAIDLCVWAATEGRAAKVDMIAPTLHWAPPRYFGDNDPEKGVFNEQVLYSRFAEWRLPVCVEAVTPINGAPPAPLGFYHLDPRRAAAPQRVLGWGLRWHRQTVSDPRRARAQKRVHRRCALPRNPAPRVLSADRRGRDRRPPRAGLRLRARAGSAQRGRSRRL